MTSNTRAIWNGAISFGLVNIPVALHTATGDSGIDFEWLDKRTMDLVGYKKINKKTGQEVEKEDIVKGISYDNGRYVVISDDEIQNALAESTQIIEIESFVFAKEIPFVYFEHPYYLAPIGKADKAYTLLRETLLKMKRVGIARVVLRTKQHFAAIVPTESALVLILLRWANQIHSWKEINLPPKGGVGLTEREFAMAEQLVEAMSEPWDPEKYQDSFRAKVMALVEEKARTGHIETIIRPEVEPEHGAMAEVIDFTELLRRSLHTKIANRSEKPKTKTKSAFKSPAAEKN